MTTPQVSVHDMVNTSRKVAQRLKLIGNNRFELLAIELQEERDHILRSAILALCITALGLLAGITVTAAVVVALWATAPIVVLLLLSFVYGLAALVVYGLLSSHLRSWQSFGDSLSELRKDLLMAGDMDL